MIGFAAAGALFKAIPNSVIGIGLSVTAVVGGLLYFGSVQREVGREQIRAEWRQATELQAKADDARDERLRKEADARAAENNKQLEEAKKGRKTVVRYVDRVIASEPVLGRSDIGDVWLRGHDGAALNIDPDTLVPNGAPGSAWRSTNGGVLRTVTENYDRALNWRRLLHNARVELAVCQGHDQQWIRQNLPAP